MLKGKRKSPAEHTREARIRLKAAVIDAYGSCCTCCGERVLEFLTMDHLNGSQRDKSIPRGGHDFYSWLRKNGFPKKDYRVLCMNCNCAIGFFGYCPHTADPKLHLRERLKKMPVRLHMPVPPRMPWTDKAETGRHGPRQRFWGMG